MRFGKFSSLSVSPFRVFTSRGFPSRSGRSVGVMMLAVCAGCASSAGAPPKLEAAHVTTTPHENSGPHDNSGDASGDKGTHGTPPPTAGTAALLAPWTGPYSGLPPFGTFTAADLKPALEAAIAEKLASVERIAADTSPATFENTVAAFERAGASLDRVSAIYGVYISTMSDDTVQAIQREMEPKLAALDDAIAQNARLFERFSAGLRRRARPGSSRRSRSA